MKIQGHPTSNRRLYHLESKSCSAARRQFGRPSTILRDSGTHQSERGKDNRKRVEEALDELQEKRVLIRYETEILRGKRAKVLDAKYVLYPDMDFITEVKKSNSRALKLDEIQSKWVPLPVAYVSHRGL